MAAIVAKRKEKKKEVREKKGKEGRFLIPLSFILSLHL